MLGIEDHNVRLSTLDVLADASCVGAMCDHDVRVAPSDVLHHGMGEDGVAVDHRDPHIRLADVTHGEDSDDQPLISQPPSALSSLMRVHEAVSAQPSRSGRDRHVIVCSEEIVLHRERSCLEPRMHTQFHEHRLHVTAHGRARHAQPA